MNNWNLRQIGQVKPSTIRALLAICFTTLALCLSSIAIAATIYVPMPTGIPATDWENVQAAIDSADDGDIVQFGFGEYVFGTDSEFIVVSTPAVRLVGSPAGTVIVGGEVLPTVDQPASPYLMGDWSLLQSPPRGFYLTADEQSISNIRFEEFRTAVLMGFGDFAKTGGYIVEDCQFVDSLYGIQAHVESDEESAIRGNEFINDMYGYMISGGRYDVSYNYSTTPEPERVPVDGYTHATASLNAGDLYFAEGQARVSENNVIEHNIVEGIEDGIQIAAGPGGLVRNNLIRNNEFHDMTNYGTLSLVLSFGGDVVDNAFVNNTVDGSWVDGFLILNYAGASVDGNVLVGNEMTSILGFYGDAAYMWGATNTILLDNVINGVNPGALGYGTVFEGGHSNQFLLNDTDADTAALFLYSPDGLFASDDPADVAVDEFGNPVASLDPNSDYKKLRRCAKILTDKGKLKKVDSDDIARSIEKFRSCVDKALAHL